MKKAIFISSEKERHEFDWKTIEDLSGYAQRFNVSIDLRAEIGDNVTLHHGAEIMRSVVVEDGVEIGSHSLILNGALIGALAKIGDRVVVLENAAIEYFSQILNGWQLIRGVTAAVVIRKELTFGQEVTAFMTGNRAFLTINDLYGQKSLSAFEAEAIKPNENTSFDDLSSAEVLYKIIEAVKSSEKFQDMIERDREKSTIFPQ